MENNGHKGESTILGILQLFIGVGALAGGYGFIGDPSGESLGMPLSYLKGSPFSNFLIPGIILFTFNGIGSCIAAVLTFRRWRYAGELAMFFGSGLIIWLIVQVTIIPYHWMHTLYFGLGLLELVLGLLVRRATKK